MSVASNMYDDLTNYPDHNLSRESQILIGLCVLCEFLVEKEILSEDDIQNIIYKARSGEVL